MKILFICLGNICRSVTAEEVFRQYLRRNGLEQGVEVDSAGMIDYHEGELADPRMRKHAFDRGYKLTHRSRPVVERDFYEFDYMVVMDEDNVRRLQRLQPNGTFKAKLLRMAEFLQNYDYAYIPDPYYGDASDFELVIDLLEDASPALWEHVRAEMHGEG